MNIIDSSSISKIVGKKYRVCILCTHGCKRALVESPEMDVEQLNANWLSLMASAPKIACEEAKPCSCVSGQKVKHSITMVIIDPTKAKGVPAQDLLSPDNISMTKFSPNE